MIASLNATLNHSMRSSAPLSLIIPNRTVPRTTSPQNLRFIHAGLRRGSKLDEICRASSDSPVVVYSTSRNPYRNLALENTLLTYTDRTSRILLFYTNRPCVVIGRNQNPWLECNLALIGRGIDGVSVELLRRRSGGGTVFHDEGNLNFSVTVPNDKEFQRLKHAEMVASALKQTNSRLEELRAFEDIWVNERHDIVMGTGDQRFKVSGSAFKLTRGRALHHGTLLHSSPNLGNISAYLRSPGQDCILAKGVESVRSPVRNLYSAAADQRDELRSTITSVIATEFQTLYGNALEFELGDNDVGEDIVQKDIHELQSSEWKFGQTPRFEFKSPVLGGQQIWFSVKHGIVEDASVERLKGINLLQPKFRSVLESSKLEAFLDQVFPSVSSDNLSNVTVNYHIEKQHGPNIERRLEDHTVEIEQGHNTVEQK